jgi:hypothetical protein
MYHPDRSIQEQQLAQALHPLMRSKGYDWLPRLHQFRKSTENGFTCLILSTTAYEKESLTEAHLGIRIDHVENLAFPFTNGLPGFQPDSMSLVTPMARLFEQRYQRLPLAGEKSVEEATSQLKGQLESKGFAFLQQYSQLSQLDELLNAQPEAPVPYLHNQINRCFRAIVTAKLLQRQDFAALTEHYASLLADSLYAPEATKAKYQRLRHFLLHYSMN